MNYVKAVVIALLLGGSTAAASERVMLNQASESELAGIEGVDAASAARIVALRTERGKLSSVEELRSLGLDEQTLSTLRSKTSIQVEVADHGMTSTYDSPQAVLDEFAAEPTIQQVHDWANLYANTSPRQVSRWLRQSVTFATLPQVQLDYTLRDDVDEGFEYLNAEGAELVPNEDPFAVRTDADQGQTRTYRARLVWDLDKIVMSSERIRVINEAQDIVKLRDKVLAEATRLYFERRRMQVERLLAPKADMIARVREELRLMELTANLDALTGGAFSGALARQP